MNLRPFLILSLAAGLCSCAGSFRHGDPDWWRAEYAGYNCTQLLDESKQVEGAINDAEDRQIQNRRGGRLNVTLDGEGDTGDASGPVDPQTLSTLETRHTLLQGDLARRNCSDGW